MASGDKMDDTWEWDGNEWKYRMPLHKPAARFWHTMAYDSAREVVVLFGGGEHGLGGLGNTWEYSEQP
jgi:hypothetical protein